MTSKHLSHAAMLQLIAEGMRSPSAGIVTAEQLQRVAGILERIAVDLMVPVADDDEEYASAAAEMTCETRLHS